MQLCPVIATAATLIVTLEHSTHPLALPSVLLLVPLLFHVVLRASGHTLEDAQAAGWVMQPPVGGRRLAGACLCVCVCVCVWGGAGAGRCKRGAPLKLCVHCALLQSGRTSAAHAGDAKGSVDA